MSSSSGPDDRETPRLDVAEIEQVEGLVEQAPAERALGERGQRGRRGLDHGGVGRAGRRSGCSSSSSRRSS